MSDNLPPLPEPRGLLDTGGGWMAPTKLFTPLQMQAYALESIEADRVSRDVPSDFADWLKTRESDSYSCGLLVRDAFARLAASPQPVQRTAKQQADDAIEDYPFYCNPVEALSALPKPQPVQAQPKGCFRCVTPNKCAIYGCCPGTWPSEQPANQQKEE